MIIRLEVDGYHAQRESGGNNIFSSVQLLVIFVFFLQSSCLLFLVPLLELHVVFS